MTYNCEVEFGFEMKEESIGYTPDIRRRIQTWVYHEYVEGGGEVSVMFSYPYQKFPLKGNPSANPQSWASHWDTDDNTNFDEDLTPSDADMIYSIDSLGTSGLYVPAGYVIGDKVRFCYRFVEWVEPTDGADTVPYTGDDESGVCKWHYILEAEVKFDPVTQDLYLHPILHSVGKKHPVYPEATSFND